MPVIETQCGDSDDLAPSPPPMERPISRGNNAKGSGTGSTSTSSGISGGGGALQQIAFHMTRAALQSTDYSEDDGPRGLYVALQRYFELASERQRRAASLSISAAEVRLVLEFSLELLLEATLLSEGGPLFRAASTPSEVLIHGPLVSLDRVKARLRGASAGATAALLGGTLAEVIQLSAVLDLVHQLPRCPLGALPVLHLAALTLSLHAAAQLGDLVRLLVNTAEAYQTSSAAGGDFAARSFVAGCLVSGVLHDWSALDRRHGDALRKMSARILGAMKQDSPASISTSAFLPDEEAEALLMRSATDPVLSVEPPVQAPQQPTLMPQGGGGGAGGAEEQLGGDEDEEDTEGDSVYEEEGGDGEGIDARFWKDLAS